MRAPSFKGLRDDQTPREVLDRASPATPPRSRRRRPSRRPRRRIRVGGTEIRPPRRCSTRSSERPDGALIVRTEGRRLKLSNWDKVLYPETGFTKGDLIAYYARDRAGGAAAPARPAADAQALSERRRASSSSTRSSRPRTGPSGCRRAKIGDVDYTLAQDRPTLVWLANLADIELHTSLSLAPAPERPTMMVFDLDPGAPAGMVECCEVALVLRGLFEQLGLESAGQDLRLEGTAGVRAAEHRGRPTSRPSPSPGAIAELLEQRMPELVVSRMTKRLRPGKVLVDWSQNDEHKTTVTVYSLRARERPTVSTPVGWEEVAACRGRGTRAC